MKLRNINSASDSNCKCGSWMKHWERYRKQAAIFCFEKNCLNLATDGAQVQIANSSDNNCYIIPLCREHSKSTSQIEIMNVGDLISANKNETCEKSS